MKFGSLFSGIGGIDLGLERAGMSCTWQVEIDPYCQKVLEKHWPGVARYADVREVGKHNLEPVDLIAGGFPCQPHSTAGKRKASQDERNLWPDFYRIICELEPRWVLVENVPGILSSENGRFFGGVLRDLASSGFDAEWQSIPAAAFGAPHIRERIFICAYSAGERTRRLPVFAWEQEKKEPDFDRICKAVSNPNCTCASRFGEHSGEAEEEARKMGGGFSNGGSTLANTYGARLEKWQGVFENHGEKQQAIVRSDWWAVEPGMGRMADGIPSRVDRLRGLGNAVVPQVAEWIGERIMEYEKR